MLPPKVEADAGLGTPPSWRSAASRLGVSVAPCPIARDSWLPVPSGARSPWPGLGPAIGKQHPIGHILPPPAAEALLPQDILPTQALEYRPNQLVLSGGFIGLVVLGKTLHSLP